MPLDCGYVMRDRDLASDKSIRPADPAIYGPLLRWHTDSLHPHTCLMEHDKLLA